MQLDRLAALEGIAHGLDVRDGDARRAERPEELRLCLLHAAESGRVHGIDSVAALPPDVHIPGDRVLRSHGKGGALPRCRNIYDKPGRVEAVVLTGLRLELALGLHACQRGADGAAGRVIQMVGRVLGQRPAVVGGPERQRLAAILDGDAFQRGGGPIQQRDAAVLGLAGGLFGLLVRVGQQGQRRPGGKDEYQQNDEGTPFCFHGVPPYLRRRSSTTTAPTASTAAGRMRTNTRPSTAAV